MLETSPGLPREGSWQDALRRAVRSAAELAALLELPASAIAPDAGFPLLVPRGFVARMRKGDPHDPLLLQVLPRTAEQAQAAGFTADPLGEQAAAAGGVLQKYSGRALLITTGACPVHCRYCFRRAFPYEAQLASRSDWSAALEGLAGRADVTEVILSGGDPLSLSNARLGRLLERLEQLPRLTALRIHTRFPVMLPERIDRGLLALLGASRLPVVLVLHANHANELDPAVDAALASLKEAGVMLLNQSVLLRGVNDDADALAALSERLFAAGVLPYYLHLLDPVAGAAHFEVDEAEGRALIAALRARLPGYLVPRLARETPGAPSKTVLA